jgi:TfoX/Sxy family transcriptional regulator of competence genes
MPRPGRESLDFFESVLPDDPRVTARPMFGNMAGFVNGNMFIGLYGDDMFVRLSEEDRVELLTEEGASAFEPMKGRPMKEYVVLPRECRDDPESVDTWVSRSLAWTGEMPVKRPKKRKKKS